MPAIGTSCHELRVRDGNVNLHIPYWMCRDAVLVLDVCKKKTRSTPKRAIDAAKRRWKSYLRDAEEE